MQSRSRTGTLLRGMILFFFAATLPLQAQFDENLKRYTGDNAEGYVQPLVTALGTSFSRGWYHGAEIPSIRPYVYIGLAGMQVYLSDEDRSYMAMTQGSFSPQQEVEVSTAVGSPDAVTVTGAAGTQYAFPGGLDLNAVMAAVPQATVGGVFGTEVSIRYLNLDFEDAEFGNISLLGYGARHSLTQYVPLFPVAISAGAFYQTFTLDEDLLEVKTLHYGLQVSKGFPIATIYGGAGYDKTDVEVNYIAEDGNNTPVNILMRGEDGMRITAGLALKLAILHLHVDYTIGPQNALTLGAGLGL